MRGLTVIAAALCVAFYMASIASSRPSQGDYVTRGLLCIHHYEGSWTAVAGPFYANGKVVYYYGGLQQDTGFMQAYGPQFYRRWGTADHWPIWAQLQAGRNGYRSRGWWPWPNTARYCHLL